MQLAEPNQYVIKCKGFEGDCQFGIEQQRNDRCCTVTGNGVNLMRLREMPRELAIVTLAMIVANITSNMFGPFEPLYLQTLGARVEQVGIFFTIQTVLSIVFRLLGGWVSDNLGRLPTIAVGGIFGLGAYLGYTLAPSWQWAMIGALLAAMGSSLVAPSFQAYTAESAPEGATGSTFGLVEGLFLTCQIVGPLLGGFLVDHYGYRVMMWAATGIFSVAAIMRILMARRSPKRAGRLIPANLGRDLRALLVILVAGGLVTWMFVVDGIRDMGFQVIWPFLPKYITEVGRQSETMLGGLMAGMSVITALAMWPSGMVSDRIGERWGIAVGGLLMGAALVMMIMLPTTVGFALAFGVFGIAGAMVSPAFSSLLSKAVPRGSLGMTYGIFMSALGIVAVPAPYLGGLLYSRVGPQAPFWVAVALLMLSVPIALWKLQRPPQVVKVDRAVGTSPAETGEVAPL
jgi:MFS family permease